jgi:hypothetical protein
VKKLALIAAALLALGAACEVETDGFGSSGNAFDSRAQARTDRRMERHLRRVREARLERRRQQQLAAARRRERLAELRRERREERRREQALAAPEPEAESCTPGYDPCLVPASDYDCEGGSGDGPAYTGYVTVSGADPYDLDSDNDGVGCES